MWGISNADKTQQSLFQSSKIHKYTNICLEDILSKYNFKF